MWYGLIYAFSGREFTSLYGSYKGHRKAFILMEPEYGNLGDHAIAYASEKFIKDKFPGYHIIPVSEENTCRHLKSIKNVLEEGDIVFIQGGGNMGSLYPYIERMRRFCVEKIQNVPVICMPVSVYFGEDSKGRDELKHSLDIYNAAKNLCIFTRDKYSYEYLRKYLPTSKVKLVPDMVYYLAGSNMKNVRKNGDYLICLRKENESAIGEKNRESLAKRILSEYADAFLYDTTIWRTVNLDFRETELDTLFRMFGRAKCVITDRMHGMIISAICGTPCVVIKSFDTKIIGSYDWIKNSRTVKLIDSKSVENIENFVDEVCNNPGEYDFKEILHEFEKMKEYILDGR